MIKQIDGYSDFKAQAFTLVELIVVIVILAILSTIAFLSFQGYSSESRDSIRLTDMANINKGLELLKVNSSLLPFPEGSISTGTILGTAITYRGELRDNLSKIANISKTPLDPLTKNNYYPYGISYDRRYYQVGTVLEDGSQIGHDSRLFEGKIMDTANAANGNASKVIGNYMGYIRYSTGGNDYIANIPSLLYNNTGAVDLFASQIYFIADKGSNLAYQLPIGGPLNDKGGNALLQEIRGPGASLTGIIINGITEETFAQYFPKTTIDSFGTKIGALKNAILGQKSKGGSYYYAELTGAQQVPSNTSAGMGHAEFYLNETGTNLHFKVTFSDLSGVTSAMHIHKGASGTAGAVVSPIPSFAGTPLFATGGIFESDWDNSNAAKPLNPNLSDLKNGLLYFDIHSSLFGGGEIRGQIYEYE